MVEKASKKLPPNPYYTDRILSHVTNNAMAAQIKRLMLVKSAVRMQGGHKRGHIDSGAMWKGNVYRGTDTGRRVFAQKEVALVIDTAVTLLVDMSGSMTSRDKFTYAGAAACMLNEVFGRVGVKSRVSSFTDNSLETFTYVHKEFDEPVSKEALAHRMSAAAATSMSGNADGENVMWEWAKLMARNEPKKMLIVLSDGMPCDSKGLYNCSEHLTDVVTQIERDGRVTIVGIGILDGAVEKFYSRCRVISDVTNIEEVLLNILKQEVLRA
jgi:cobalamin biosynthesis protein CobT